MEDLKKEGTAGWEGGGRRRLEICRKFLWDMQMTAANEGVIVLRSINQISLACT